MCGEDKCYCEAVVFIGNAPYCSKHAHSLSPEDNKSDYLSEI